MNVRFLHSWYKTLPPLEAAPLSHMVNHYWCGAAERFGQIFFRFATPYDLPIEITTSYMGDFINRERYVCVFPLSFFSQFLGLGFRSLLDKKNTVYSFYKFTCFTSSAAQRRVKEQSLVYGTPLVFAEDPVSAEVLGSLYPWSFGYLGSRISASLALYLSMITNHIIMFPDNDMVKNFKLTEVSRFFSSLGTRLSVLRIPEGFNDAGDLLKESLKGKDVSAELNYLKNVIHTTAGI